MEIIKRDWWCND